MATARRVDVHGIEIPQAGAAQFCERHHIRKLSLFGSILTDRFRSDSSMNVAKGRTRDDLSRDRALQLTLVKEIEIVGEFECPLDDGDCGPSCAGTPPLLRAEMDLPKPERQAGRPVLQSHSSLALCCWTGKLL